MKKSYLIVAAVAAASMVGSLLPAAADPQSQRDMAKIIQQAPKRYLASEPGKQEQLTLLFGPYSIPPGQDSNRISVDVQLPPGFIRSVSPELVEAATGRVPTEQEAHIHHAHWFRVTTESDELYYTNLGNPRAQAQGVVNNFPEEVREQIPSEVLDSLPANAGLSWVFGTGEEKTQGGFAPREALEDADGNGVPDVRYGMEIDGGERQVLIYMIHNKTAAPMNVFVTLDVEFIHGTSAEIEAASGIPMRELKGQLFGTTQTANPNNPRLVTKYRAEVDSTAIVSGGHTHPGSYGVVVTNQGPNQACSADFDRDGYPGITMFRSRKIDHVPGSWPYSEDFQMGVTKYGWRAPIHKGDVISQIAPHDVNDDGATANDFALPGNYQYPEIAPGETIRDLPRDTVDMQTHSVFQSMNHVGMYFDPEQPPQPYSADLDANGCPKNFANTYGVNGEVLDDSGVAEPYLLGADTPAVQQRLRVSSLDGLDPYYASGVKEGMQNHVWPALDPTCGEFFLAKRTECEDGLGYADDGTGIETDTIHISGFVYAPGGYGLPGSAGAPARVKKGTSLRIVNEDAMLNVRHTLTTCPWPCTGTYVANYPFPDGVLDTNKLGNIDPVEGAPVSPVYSVSTQNLDPGFYSYFCRIHPFMRGAFEVVA
ncbi:MAG: hypothetical protein ACLGH3_02760 [Actinomycetota bacterium]